jgi:hypothetical protein
VVKNTGLELLTRGRGGNTKKLLTIPLEDEDIIELYRIMLDGDPDGALAFSQTHVKSKVRDLLEGKRLISSRFISEIFICPSHSLCILVYS